MESNDYLPFADTVQSKHMKKPTKWLLATNQLNQMFMLAAGMILPPQGFGAKYYKDSLADFPGWIPLFADNIPMQVLDAATSEGKYLIPCIASINLTSLSGRIVAIMIDGTIRDILFPNDLNGNESVLLIPAPLPTNWIESVFFRSKEEKTDCERDAQGYSNVPLSDFKREVIPSLFTKFSGVAWPPQDFSFSQIKYPIDIVNASGGMIAMMYKMGNIGEIGSATCRLAFDGESEIAVAISDPMISALFNWLNCGTAPLEGDVLPKLFWGVIERVALSKSNQGEISPQDAALDFLETAKESLDDRLRSALTKLLVDLRSIAALTDSTISELFQRHPRPFSRVLTLFFLREKCSELLEFKHPLLTETDYVVAALLFSARDGWLGLSTAIRADHDLNMAVPHRMCSMAHRLAGTGLLMGNPPKRCVPLRELFSSGNKEWSVKQKDAALLLAREYKWDCVHTKITLGKGEYRLVIDGSGTHILLPGDIKAVTVEINREDFLSRISMSPVSDKLEKKVREVFKK